MTSLRNFSSIRPPNATIFEFPMFTAVWPLRVNQTVFELWVAIKSACVPSRSDYTFYKFITYHVWIEGEQVPSRLGKNSSKIWRRSSNPVIGLHLSRPSTCSKGSIVSWTATSNRIVGTTRTRITSTRWCTFKGAPPGEWPTTHPCRLCDCRDLRRNS